MRPGFAGARLGVFFDSPGLHAVIDRAVPRDTERTSVLELTVRAVPPAPERHRVDTRGTIER
jgi:hypothetical protein